MEADHDIGHLHAGVVDVVLHLDAVAEGAQHAHERVAQRGVAQVADVRRLVGIDVGVLDDDLFAGGRRGCGIAAQERSAIRAAVEPDIDVAVAGHFERGDAWDRADLLDQLRGDLLGRLPELFGELECNRHGHLAELSLPRLLDGDRNLDAVADQNVGAESVRNLFFNGMEHGRLRV